MPLVLSLRVGQDFFVGTEQVTVTKITGCTSFELTVVRTGRIYAVSDREATELRELPDVYLSSGDRPQAGIARVAIDAPREIAILRGDAARHPKPEPAEDEEEAVMVEDRRNRWA